MVVYKYKLSTHIEATLMLPKGAQVLRVDVQKGTMFLWAMVDPDAEKEARVFDIFGTGSPIPDFNRRFINTFFTHDGGTYVFHAFERIHPNNPSASSNS